MTSKISLPQMRTHCIGRFLIDLPEDFVQTPGSDVELVYGLDKNFRKVKIEVARPSEDGASFDDIAGKRAAELMGSEHFESPLKTMLALQRRLDAHTVLIRSYSSARIVDSYRSEIYAEKGSAVAIFTDDVYTGESTDAIEAKILRVVEHTRYVQNPNEAGRGSCFGPLLIDAGQDGEFFTVGFTSNRMPDVKIGIDMNTMLAESDGGLLKRWDSKADMLTKLNFKSDTLRRGKVTMGGMPAEELLSKGKDQGHVVRQFDAETLLLKSATPAAPSFAINMTMGGQVSALKYVDASMTESDAIAVWDAIVKSIRLRPGSV